MIGLVLAAGAGRRLRPYTDTLPKALVPVDGDTTIFDIALRNLAQIGLNEVVVVVGYRAEAVAARQLEWERRYGVTLELVHNEKAEEWNNAYSLWLAREHFARGVLMVNGDTVHPVSVEHTLLAARDAGEGGPEGGPATDADGAGSGPGLRGSQAHSSAPDSAGSGPGLRGSQAHSSAPDIILAIDDQKRLADEEMKVIFSEDGRLTRITKLMDPAAAHGEYIGANLIMPQAADRLADALRTTWERDPNLYYEDGFQELVERGGVVRGAPIGDVPWVEVDNQQDLARAREIACRY